MAEIIFTGIQLGFIYGVYKSVKENQLKLNELRENDLKKLNELRENLKEFKEFKNTLYEIYIDKSKENDIEHLIEVDKIIQEKIKKINKISQIWRND